MLCPMNTAVWWIGYGEGFQITVVLLLQPLWKYYEKFFFVQINQDYAIDVAYQSCKYLQDTENIFNTAFVIIVSWPIVWSLDVL